MKDIQRVVDEIYTINYRRRLRDLDNAKHVGYVMDGNRRFAKMQKLPSVVDGHYHGTLKLSRVLLWTFEYTNITTVWAFSTENFSRNKDEVDDLITLITNHLNSCEYVQFIHYYKIKINVIGNRELMPKELLQAAENAEHLTKHYTKKTWNIALAYGGRQEIVDSVRIALKKFKTIPEASKSLTADDISSETYCQKLGLPQVDYVVRTGGDIRTSGFMLWDSPYSEFAFKADLWPNLVEVDILELMLDFANRKRTFGK